MNSLQAITGTHSTTHSIASTPLNRPPLSAQESREKRLAHQQSRFRDRGGVFVPQQRTALLDILLGKTTLKQVTARRRSRSRSTSHSPVRRKSIKGALGDNGEPAYLPRVKKGRKSVIEVAHNDEGPVAGPSRPKKAISHKLREKADTVKSKRSLPEKSIPKLSAGPDELIVDSPNVLLNARDSRKTIASLDEKTHEIPKPRRTSSRKTNAPANTRKGKEIATQDAEEETEPDGTGKKNTRKGKSKAAVTKPKDKKAPQTRSKAPQATARKSAPNLTLPSENEQDSNEGDKTSDYPSSPLTHRAKRRAATKIKNYTEDDTEHEVEDARHQKKASQAETKSAVSKHSTKIAQQRQKHADLQEVVVEDTIKQNTRPALTPVPEESEPESEAEREGIVARRAQDLARAISKTVEDFAPVSRDQVHTDKVLEKGLVVAKGRQRKKNAVVLEEKGKDFVVKSTLVNDEMEAASKQDQKNLDSTKVKGKRGATDEKNNITGSSKSTESPKAARGGKGRGRTKTKAPDSLKENVIVSSLIEESEATVLPSPPRPLKRTRPIVEPEDVESMVSSRTRKKVRTIEKPTAVTNPTSTSRSRTGKPTVPQEDEAVPYGIERNDKSSADASQNKRKRAVLTEAKDHEEASEHEPDKKKSKSRKTAQEKDPPPELNSSTKPRKQKENPATATPSKSADTSKPSVPPAKKTAKPQSRKPTSTSKRGPPQSVLDLIKKSAAHEPFTSLNHTPLCHTSYELSLFLDIPICHVPPFRQACG
ncbi:hypothetical protein LENED_002275 [Lentinula edodes]|uniref:Uncharacterized protein n=1 Tax=Lentinula edodes TaxID=5353 RepID=A0A1Q3E141_LENED|nr:hypothetical protein LENED_002275 [Lentinula edodes]